MLSNQSNSYSTSRVTRRELPRLWKLPFFLAACPSLLRQYQLALDVERLRDHRRTGIWLAATD
jgi:hypothetical protein